MYTTENTPEQNLETLAANPYPGRLLVVGFCGEAAVQAYAIEGRSEGSRNRVLTVQDNIVSTEIFDTSLSVGDPTLTIYDAMRSVGDVYVVSNGTQTNTVAQYLRSGRSFEEAMAVTEHEPDAPNFTPRITAYIQGDPGIDEPYLGISVISRDAQTNESVRKLYTDQNPEIEHKDGVGYCVHTYKGDGDPLPSFDEAPFAVPVYDDATAMAESIWDNLDPANRVAVAAKVIMHNGLVEIKVINRHDSK